MKVLRKFFQTLGLVTLAFGLSPAGHAAIKMCPYTLSLLAMAAIDQVLCKNLPAENQRTACRIGSWGVGASVFGYGTYRAFGTYGGSAITHPVTEQDDEDDADVEADIDIDIDID